MTATRAQTETVETTEQDAKQRLHEAIDALPKETLAEVASFVEYQRYKHAREQEAAPSKPVALGGLWKGLDITDEDIDEIRQEMWADFGERDVWVNSLPIRMRLLGTSARMSGCRQPRVPYSKKPTEVAISCSSRTSFWSR